MSCHDLKTRLDGEDVLVQHWVAFVRDITSKPNRNHRGQPHAPAFDPERPPLWDLSQAAAWLGISPHTLRERLPAAPSLCPPCVRIGRRILFDPRDVFAWLDRQKGEGA